MSSANSKIQEPSMEEILASIRRIIADDQEVLRSASGEQSESSLTTVLDLTERQTAQMLAQSNDEPRSERDQKTSPGADERDKGRQRVSYHDEREDDGDDDLPLSEGVPEAAFADPLPTDALLSNAANASVSGAFTRLGATVLPTQPQTLEDLMKDLLRPMLKAWLEDNLPSLVERLVQAEIARISRNQL